CRDKSNQLLIHDPLNCTDKDAAFESVERNILNLIKIYAFLVQFVAIFYRLVILSNPEYWCEELIHQDSNISPGGGDFLLYNVPQFQPVLNDAVNLHILLQCIHRYLIILLFLYWIKAIILYRLNS